MMVVWRPKPLFGRANNSLALLGREWHGKSPSLTASDFAHQKWRYWPERTKAGLNRFFIAAVKPSEGPLPDHDEPATALARPLALMLAKKVQLVLQKEFCYPLFGKRERGHMAVSGTGTYGKPSKFARLLNFAVQVACVLSHPG
jgi:hypothetical protein